MKRKTILFQCFLLSLLLFVACSKEETTPVINPPTPEPPPTTEPPVVEKGAFRVGFYNVENLFDTKDDPDNAQDNEFLPASGKAWTEARYEKKITNIGKVIQGIEFPVLMGIAEVENNQVLEDLAASDLLKSHNYQIVHEDSPDFRGIDVALLYKSDFKVLNHKSITVTLPPSVSEYSTTRDILMVEGTLYDEAIYIFVNHWPSRSGGVAATSGKREYVAGVLRAEIDAILATDADANVLVMGDLNDEPYNKSVQEVLKASTEKPSNFDNALYNCTIPLTMAGAGSYLYDGNWQMIDQIIVSGRLLDAEGTLKVLGFDVFKDDLVLFDHPEDGPSPNRTYGGDNYYGGFSDHLAIYLEMDK